MSDWQVGDLALCVDDAPADPFQVMEVRAGRVYRVIAVTTTSMGNAALALEGVINTRYAVVGEPAVYLLRRFRKIEPDKREACEEEFVTLIKRAKRPVSA